MNRFPYLLVFGQVICSFAQLESPSWRGAEAPPPATGLFTISGGEGRVHGTATVYSIGDPTPEEQLYLEVINRARANPAAEAARLVSIQDPAILADYQAAGVDLNLMQEQFTAFGPAQPVAFNPKLSTAARAHSQDMFVNVFQEHTGSDGSTPFDRLTGVAYYGSAGENIYSNAKSVEHGHAAFEVDWGGTPATGGMQSPAGHRDTIHNPAYREVGIGVVLGLNSSPGKQPLDHVGPQLVTEDFGVQQNSTPFITGVVYYDLNGNGFYDVGEGIGDVHVTVTGANYEGVSARSGGYAVPVPGNGNYSVTFSGAGFAPVVKAVSVVGSKNQKVDFIPTYTAPAVSGPTVASVGRANAYTISAVPGANAYQWRVFQRVAAAPEGAENDFARVTVTQSASYDVIEGIRVKSGQNAFHLVTPGDAPRSQYLTLAPTYVVNSSSVLQFQSELAVASPNQHARVQVSSDGGATWQTVYSQDGAGVQAERQWSLRTVPLGSYAGKLIRVRFGFEFFGGEYYPGSDLDLGWLIDDIQFTNTQEIVNELVSDTTITSVAFSPSVVGDYSLQARARTGHEFLDWGPVATVRAAAPSGAADIRAIVNVTGGQLQIEGDLVAGGTPSKVTLESSTSLGGGWQAENTIIQSLSGNRYGAAIPVATAGAKFFRFRAE